GAGGGGAAGGEEGGGGSVFPGLGGRGGLPATLRELELEHALAREAIALALRAPGARIGGLHPLDVIVGTGGVLANAPDPAMAALILLDALQPRGVTSLVLDTGPISNMLGAVAALGNIPAAH